MAMQTSGNSPRTSRRPTRRLAPGDRRRQIVDAAAAFFAEVGFEGGTRALAERLGVTQPLIYRYFPSKDELIREVYQAAYLNRWEAAWDQLIVDRSIPVRERLGQFYREYTTKMLRPELIRLFLFAGLRGLEMNRLWLRFIEDRVIRKFCAELRHAHGLPSVEAVRLQPEEIDLYWVFHGSIFYYGVRRDVLRGRTHVDIDAFIDNGIDGLLNGYPATVRRILSGQSIGIC
jgi:AcrR family transcriptional regulator